RPPCSTLFPYTTLFRAPLIVLNELGGEDAHESGQNDQVGRMGIDERGECLIIGGSVGEFSMIENGARNTGPGGALQTEGIGAVGNHRDNVSLPGMQSIDKSLQVAA